MPRLHYVDHDFGPRALEVIRQANAIIADYAAQGYDLNGEFGPWAPPPPFAGNPHWRLTRMSAAWSQSEMLTYVDYCRRRVRDTLVNMTDAKAATPLPPVHRYSGQPHAWIIVSTLGHTIEHASQIRQFIASRDASGGNRGSVR